MKEVSTLLNETKWYQLSVEQTFEELGADSDGLTSDEAKARLKKYGYNETDKQITPGDSPIHNPAEDIFPKPLYHVLKTPPQSTCLVQVHALEGMGKVIGQNAERFNQADG